MGGLVSIRSFLRDSVDSAGPEAFPATAPHNPARLAVSCVCVAIGSICLLYSTCHYLHENGWYVYKGRTPRFHHMFIHTNLGVAVWCWYCGLEPGGGLLVPAERGWYWRGTMRRSLLGYVIRPPHDLRTASWPSDSCWGSIMRTWEEGSLIRERDHI